VKDFAAIDSQSALGGRRHWQHFWTVC